MENHSLIFDLVSWIGKEPRAYNEVMDAWRTSCPRLSIWEDATDSGFIERSYDKKGKPIVCITEKGVNFLKLKH